MYGLMSLLTPKVNFNLSALTRMEISLFKGEMVLMIHDDRDSEDSYCNGSSKCNILCIM